MGKVILLFWLGLLVLISIVNGGQVTFVDETLWRYESESNLTERAFVLWMDIFLTLTPAAIAFEAMMFVHATLKDTVFGIDNNLRKTFTTAVFTGIGVISFIVGSELMESVIGYGAAGGVFVGISILAVKPILVILDKASNRFIPSTHTPEETAYLEACLATMEDLIITAEERKLLDTVAATFGLNDKIVKQLEDEYNSTLEEE